MNIIDKIKIALLLNKLYEELKEALKMKNWMTTVVGVVGAIAQVAYSMLATGVVDTKTWITACVTAALGVLAKDFNVTGGSKPQ